MWEPKLNIMKHDEPFVPSNPSKKGYNGTIGKFPEYLESPKQEIKRNKEEEKLKTEKFRPTYNGLSKPSPSISLNKLNLKKEAGGRRII